MKYSSLLFLILFFFSGNGNSCDAQGLNLPQSIEWKRVNQFNGVDTNYSLCIQPMSGGINSSLKRKTVLGFYDETRNLKFLKKAVLTVLPLQLQQQYNSQSPYGSNDGAMIPAKGYQVYASAGFKIEYGHFHLQLNPEVVWAQNQNFDILNTRLLNSAQTGTVNVFYSALIDNPEKVKGGNYHNINLGQSSVYFQLGKVAAGISNRNLWWGPGIDNSLIMSNNAPGFLHASFYTVKPVETRIGNFEWQFLSGFAESRTEGVGKGYINGLVVNYNPKGIKGFYIGAIRVFNQFYSTAQKYHDYFPVFGNLFRSRDKVIDDSLYRDQISSIFFRYVFAKAHGEIYAEYGREDASYNLRDFLMSPDHSRGFIVGGQKIFNLNKEGNSILMRGEVTQLQRTNTYLLRPTPPWYVNGQVTRGWTNMGKIMGAGIGPGSNSLNFNIQWMKPNVWWGLELAQIERNNDLYYELFTNPAINRKWVDYVLGFNGNFFYGKEKKILINWNVNYIRSKNYLWDLNEYAPDDLNTKTMYRGNLHIKISTVYRF